MGVESSEEVPVELSVIFQEAENWGVTTRCRPLYTPGACELWTADQARYRVKGGLWCRSCGTGKGLWGTRVVRVCIGVRVQGCAGDRTGGRV